MALGKKILLTLSSFGLVLLSACSGSSGGGGNALLSVSQDLTVDPEGLTTVLTFKKDLPAVLGPGNFTADGGQLALTVDVLDAVATVTWDERVTPSHTVTPTSIGGVGESAHAVTTTDSSAPTFAVTAATQEPGLGGDTIAVAFSGPYVVAAQVEDVASWDLVVNGESMDLTGSVLLFDPVTQTLDVTLGSMANLHASFELSAAAIQSVADVAVAATAVAGAATGDLVAPTFVSAVQNLTEDELGYVVDFTFSEAMDPVFATKLSNFDAGFPVFASSVEQVSDEVLRATFTNPMVPGLDEVTLIGDLMDAHGNALTFPATPVAIVAGSTVANGFASPPVFEAVEDAGGDLVTLVFTQALDPDTAEESARWDVQSPLGISLDLSAATFTYDLETKTMQIEVAEDGLFGDSFQVGPSAGPDVPIDVDGESFATTFGGAVSGDAVAVTVEGVLQNRVSDFTGLTYDVMLSEDVDAVEAENVANWSVTGGAAVVTATLLPTLSTVRLVLDAVAIPGADTLSASGLVDLAGNAMPAPQTAVAIASTDIEAPSASGLTAYAYEGADNDVLTVAFDDAMLAADVADTANWTVEMPAGTPLDATLAGVDYDAVSQVATLTFDGGDEMDLLVREDVQVVLANMRDVAGNAIVGGALQAEVDGESTFPGLESVWVDAGDPTRLHVQFTEPMRYLDDITGATEYVVRDGSGLVAGQPAVVTPDADRHGATLRLGFAAVGGTHTLDVNGLADLAGNALFPVLMAPTLSEDPNEPGLAAGLSTAVTVSGEDNDVLTMRFDRAMSAWGMLDPGNFDLSDGAPVDLTGAELEFDGDDTLTIRLSSGGSPNLDTGTGYTLSADDLRSAQGVAMTSSSADLLVAAGDAASAVQSSLRTRVDAANPTDSVLVEFNEAVDPTEAADVSNFLKGGVSPTTATRLGHRTVRATWAGGVSAGDQIDVTMTDLAGNVGVTNQLAQAPVSTGPALVSVAGVIAPGFGGDRVVLTFSAPLSPAQATLLANYTLDQGGVALDLAGTSIRMSSASNQIALHLPVGVELDPFQQIHATVANVTNQDGIAMSPAGDLAGAVSGDSTPAGFAAAFVNHREDAGGLVVDVRFTEDVDTAFAEMPASFTVSGGQTVVGAELLREDVLRLTLSAPLGIGQTIGTTALPDAAGIPSGAISIAPEL